MTNYRIVYRDVMNYNRPDVEFIIANNQDHALEKFVKNRRGENWSNPDIFQRSLFMIIQDDREEKFTIEDFDSRYGWNF
ncbi:MAG TPA: hypothetical protein VKA68_06455 [bacterium]|nr:hypothetical protein [bacterium]